MNPKQRVMNEIKYLKSDLDHKIKEEFVKTKENDNNLLIDFKVYQKEVFEKLSELEYKSRIDLENFRTIFENSNRERLRYLGKKILGGEDVKEKAPVQKNRNIADDFVFNINIPPN